MSVDLNKSVVRRFFEEFWNLRKPEVADEIFAINCVTHQLRSGSDDVAAPRGPEVMKPHLSEWIAAFPDLQYSIEQMTAEGDRVVTYIFSIMAEANSLVLSLVAPGICRSRS